MWKEGSDQVVVSSTQDPPPADGYEERLNECDRVVMYVAAQAGDGRHRDMRCHIHISLFFCHQLDFPSLPFPVTLYLASVLSSASLLPWWRCVFVPISKRSKRKILQSCVRVHARPRPCATKQPAQVSETVRMHKKKVKTAGMHQLNEQ